MRCPGPVPSRKTGDVLIANPTEDDLALAEANKGRRFAKVGGALALLPLTLAEAKSAKANAIYAKGRADTLAIFSQLPPGVQAQFQPVFVAADEQAKAGNVAVARGIIATCEPGASLTATRDALADALTPLVAAAEALAALPPDATVEDVEAIEV